MLKSSRNYALNFGRILVPMAKGDRSGRVLEMAFDMASRYGSDITALTVKDEVHDLTWSDKVSMVTDAYRQGRDRGIKVIPKVRTGRSAREVIVDEANSHQYDLVMIATTRRSPLSASVFGGIGDHVVKNSRTPVIATSVRVSDYPYRSVLLLLSENIASRASITFALTVKAITGAVLHIADLRSYDRNPSHGFKRFFDNFHDINEEYGDGIEIVRGGLSTNMRDEIDMMAGRYSADAVITGVATDPHGNLRFSSTLKSVIKESNADTILVKK